MRTISRGEYIEAGSSARSAAIRSKEWLGKSVATMMKDDVEYVMKMSVEYNPSEVVATLEFKES